MCRWCSSKIEIRIEVKAKACTNWMNRQSGFFFWLQLIHFHKYPNKKLLPNSRLKWKEYCSKEGHCNECKRKHIFRILLSTLSALFDNSKIFLAFLIININCNLLSVLCFIISYFSNVSCENKFEIFFNFFIYFQPILLIFIKLMYFIYLLIYYDIIILDLRNFESFIFKFSIII